MFRQLILLTLGKVKDLQVVGEFGLGKPGLEFCLREKPDMLVVDLMLPDLNGLDIAREVRRAVPEMIRDYPEPMLFGPLPAWGLYVRHAADLRLRDITLRLINPDARPAVVLDDVTGVHARDCDGL